MKISNNFHVHNSFGRLVVHEKYALGIGTTFAVHLEPNEDALSGYGATLEEALNYQAKSLNELAAEIKKLARETRRLSRRKT